MKTPDAAADLAAALVAAWHRCDDDGGDLGAVLAYALGLAGRTLCVEAGEKVTTETAVELLVSRRPGSFESAAVARLAYPAELVEDDRSP